MISRTAAAAGLAVVAFALAGALLGALLPGLTAITGGLLAVVLYPLGVLFDLLPPGRGDREPPRPEPWHRERPLAAAPARVVYPPERPSGPGVTDPPQPTARAAAPAPPPPAAQGDRSHREPVAAPGVVLAGVFAAALTALLVLMALVIAGESDGDDATPIAARQADEVGPEPSPTLPARTTEPATPTPTATATATATPETPTPTPVPPTPTPVPPTPTPVPPTRQPTAPATAARPDGWLSGTWRIVDRVTTGQDAGQAYVFDVTLSESGGVISGSGGGLTLRGTRSGDTVSVTFTRAGAATGSFRWEIRPDGSLFGFFEDHGAANSGTSIANRVG